MDVDGGKCNLDSLLGSDFDAMSEVSFGANSLTLEESQCVASSEILGSNSSSMCP